MPLKPARQDFDKPLLNYWRGFDYQDDAGNIDGVGSTYPGTLVYSSTIEPEVDSRIRVFFKASIHPQEANYRYGQLFIALSTDTSAALDSFYGTAHSTGPQVEGAMCLYEMNVNAGESINIQGRLRAANTTVLFANLKWAVDIRRR